MDCSYDSMSSDHEELEDVEIIQAIPERNIGPRIFPFEELRERDFFRRYRLTKATTLAVLQLIESKLEFSSNRNNSVTPINQLLCALRYYATGSQQITCGDVIGVHDTTACRIIHRVTDALACLYPIYIKCPENPVLEMQKFHQIGGFPRVVGCIDCTHVRIQSPGGENAEIWRNRKGYFSMNVQAIVKSDMTFSDVVARWHGSAHDSNIWDNSGAKREFERGNRPNQLLLGDSGYAQTTYMMVPILHPANDSETQYNTSQIKTRNLIERTFGVWKRRFPILSRGIAVNICRVPGIVIACAVLHNIARIRGEDNPVEDPDYPVPHEPIIDLHINASLALVHRITPGQRARKLLIEQHFSR